MSSLDRQPDSFLDSLTRDLECPICMVEKELRILPCQHMYCQGCLVDFYQKRNANHTEGEVSRPLTLCEDVTNNWNCPKCQRDMTKRPEEYPVCAMAEHFRDVKQKLILQFSKKSPICKMAQDNVGRCQTDGCQREVDKACTRCNKFICFRCNDEPCEGDDDVHTTKNITDLVADSKEAYATWEDGITKKLECKITDVRLATDGVQHSAAILHECERREVRDLAIKLVPDLVANKQVLEKLQPEIDKMQTELAFMSNRMESVTSELELIKMVEELQLYDNNYTRCLGEMEHILTDVTCCDAKPGPNGHMMACLNGFLQILDSKSGKTIAGFTFKGYQIFTIQYYKDVVVLGLSEESQTNHFIVVLDENYTELRRWKSINGIDLVVVDDKVHLSNLREGMEEIAVYDLETGEKQGDIITRNGSNTGMAFFYPSSIVVLDQTYDQVQKYNINKKRFTTAWSKKVIKPWCTSTDENGIIWIRSNVNDCITLITRKGETVQEVADDRVTALGDIHGLGVYNSYLWLGHSGGLTRFKIEAA